MHEMPRNGFVFCANHHLAFDGGLFAIEFAIEPSSLTIEVRSNGHSSSHVGITIHRINSLRNLPHLDALTWRYPRWRNHSE